ncbi:hypothetical protein TNCV_1976351 [Trichonephila clavipes]|nr:hypothetical protein TNCV_1976351 [Trichonephila clavipes]
MSVDNYASFFCFQRYMSVDLVLLLEVLWVSGKTLPVPFMLYLRLSLEKFSEIGNVNDEFADFGSQINLEVESDDIQELLHSHNQKLTIDELTQMHEQKQDIEEVFSLDPIQLEAQMMVGNSTEGLSLIEKRIINFREYKLENDEHIFSTKIIKIVSIL